MFRKAIGASPMMERELLRLSDGPIHVLGKDPFFHTDPLDLSRGLNWDGVILYQLRKELQEEGYGQVQMRPPSAQAAAANPEVPDNMDTESSKSKIDSIISKDNIDLNSVNNDTESDLGELLPPNLDIDEAQSELDYEESEISQNEENELLENEDAISNASNSTTAVPMDVVKKNESVNKEEVV
jgi:hypothetical protein